ncbi:MAG: hypothetical protein EPN79_16195 [Burkholderiaceae bacterium]|nr:MAG: hypothetical protein EPN79_16195 [Burkholderiaceae bacterium]
MISSTDFRGQERAEELPEQDRQRVNETAWRLLASLHAQGTLRAGPSDFADPRGLNEGGAVACMEEVDRDATMTLYWSEGQWSIEFWEPNTDAVQVDLGVRPEMGVFSEGLLSALSAAVDDWRLVVQSPPHP